MQVDTDKIRAEYFDPMVEILDKYKAGDEFKSEVIDHTNVMIDKVIEAGNLIVNGFDLVYKSELVIGKLVELINDHHKNVQLPNTEDLKLYHGATSILTIVGWAKDKEE